MRKGNPTRTGFENGPTERAARDFSGAVPALARKLQTLLDVGLGYWLIDMGPEGGAGGGQVLAVEPPEAIAACEGSHTGRFLRAVLAPAA